MNTTNHCLEFSKKIADDIFIIKICFGSVGVLISLFVFLLILVTKVYKTFVYRLVMYLMVVNALQALSQVLELIPIVVTDDNQITLRNGTIWTDFCSTFGFLEIVASWNGNLVIIWTMLYVLVLSWRIRSLLVSHDRTVAPPSDKSQRDIIKSKYREMLCVILLLISPLLFTWVPFIKGMYGPSGLWCWIKTISMTDESQCGNERFQHLSITLMMVMFYGPLVVILVFGLVCMTVAIILPWRSSKHLQGKTRQKYKSSMKEIGFVLVYPAVYWIFCSFVLVNRIYSSIHTNTNNSSPYYPLWVIHAVADPARIVIPALAFLLHPYAWKNILSRSSFNKCGHTRAKSSVYVTPMVGRSEYESIHEVEDVPIRTSTVDYGSIY